MLQEPMMEKMTAMRLLGMVDALKAQEQDPTAHEANQHERRTSAIDERTTRHQGYGISQRKRKRVEEIFGWIKTIAGLRKTRHRGKGESRMDVHLRSRRLQSGSDAEPSASRNLRLGKAPDYALGTSTGHEITHRMISRARGSSHLLGFSAAC